MSLRKIAGLLVAFGLVLGLIGGGVGAAFTDTLTATETINVGTFSCIITDATAGATIASGGKSVSYTAPTINSSAAGSAPFYFQVKNAGSITALLKVTESPALSAPFSYIGTPIADETLAANATHNYNTGVQWTELSNANLGTSGTVTWTVSCGEVPATQTSTSNVLNFGSTGWGGHSCPPGTDIVSASVVGDTQPYTLALAKTGVSIDGFTYPVYPHYTYGANEEGSVVHNGAIGQSLQIVNVCTRP